MTRNSTVRWTPDRLPAGLRLEGDTHIWLLPEGDLRVRCGLDPLGAETSGDIVALSFEPVGKRIERGQAFGHLEAAKFVGPLLAPIAGTIASHNREVVANPALLDQDPWGRWLIELEMPPGTLEAEARLLAGGERICAWLDAAAERYRREGRLAE